MRDLAKARKRDASKLAKGWRAGVDMVTAAITEVQRDDTDQRYVFCSCQAELRSLFWWRWKTVIGYTSSVDYLG